jgi:hypothetical protein
MQSTIEKSFAYTNEDYRARTFPDDPPKQGLVRTPDGTPSRFLSIPADFESFCAEKIQDEGAESRISTTTAVICRETDLLDRHQFDVGRASMEVFTQIKDHALNVKKREREEAYDQGKIMPKKEVEELGRLYRQLQSRSQFYSQIRFHADATRVATQLAQRGHVVRVITAIVLMGRTSTGKTTFVYRNFQDPTLGTAGLVYKVRRSQDWWDGYIDQNTIVFDDFVGDVGKTGQTVEVMLDLLQGLPLQYSQVKGGFTGELKFKYVVFTTNLAFDEWYNGWQGVAPRTKAAFRSRIFHIVDCDADPNFGTENLRQRVVHDVGHFTEIPLSLDGGHIEQ